MIFARHVYYKWCSDQRELGHPIAVNDLERFAEWGLIERVSAMGTSPWWIYRCEANSFRELEDAAISCEQLFGMSHPF